MIKTLKCCGCKQRFDNPPAETAMAGNFHNMDCLLKSSIARGNKNRVAAEKKKVSTEKKEHTAAKKNLRESNVKWMKNKAKTITHKYIRLRDKDLPCISCGRFEHEIDSPNWDHIWDAGHYLTRAAFPELKYCEINIHKQCVRCNTAPKFHGQDVMVRDQYRINLIAKIGLEKVEWLEGPHEIPKITTDYLKQIQETYKRKTKEIES